jgi:hypothetical protein
MQILLDKWDRCFPFPKISSTHNFMLTWFFFSVHDFYLNTLSSSKSYFHLTHPHPVVSKGLHILCMASGRENLFIYSNTSTLFCGLSAIKKVTKQLRKSKKKICRSVLLIFGKGKQRSHLSNKICMIIYPYMSLVGRVWEGWDLINRFNLATCLCLFQAKTWISSRVTSLCLFTLECGLNSFILFKCCLAYMFVN